MTDDTLEKAKVFSGDENPKMCDCDHKLQGTGVFYQSVKLIQCTTCKGWQSIRKPVKFW